MLEISCPSGLRGTIRGMKVKDEQLFTDKKLSRQGRVITELLRACWENIVDPGPYQFGTTVAFEQLLATDRNAILIKLRAYTFGDDYEFQATCEACKHRFGWGVNLAELEEKPVSPSGIQHIKTGEPLLIDLPDGRAIKTRLLTGKDEEFIATLGTKDEPKVMTYNLARRIVEIDGKKDWKDVVGIVEDMEARTADFLWDAFDELEGGTDTMFKIACPRCDAQQTTMLPFEASFFSSRKRFAPSKTSASG